MDPSYLEPESTETVLMRHAEPTTYVLCQLGAIGVRLAVNDFGTGYSSMCHLTRFPIDSLKLDRPFLSNIIAKSNNVIFISAIISVAKSFKRSVIVGGVGTAERLTFLQAHQCDETQGCSFSWPVLPEQFAKLLKTSTSEKVLH
jgi:EAL domain-containing protein (putative c-di-GMP-specific phosphodiesterase class I)